MKKFYTLTRAGSKGGESYIYLHDGFSTRAVDPQQEVFAACGTLFVRTRCIVSFADGLVAAGNHVTVHDKRWPGHHPYFGPHTVIRGQAIMIYHFLGLAWGTGRWDEVKAVLARVPLARRRSVYEMLAAQSHQTWIPAIPQASLDILRAATL